MKKTLSLFLALIMLICAVPFTANANPSDVKKTTENYDGYHFVKGTKATWDCSLYTLNAVVTSVSGSVATFSVTYSGKTEEAKKYEIKIVANDNWDTYSTEKAVSFKVDTSKCDILSTSGVIGMQFVKFVIMNGANEAATYALGYYLPPDFTIHSNSLSVKKTSVYLGIYGFESFIQYRVKGKKDWSKKSFAANTKMNLTGLKAGTTYEIIPVFKFPYTDPETNGKKYVLDTVCKTITLTTSINKKPAVTSVKISKFKNGKKKKINGYWETDGDWHPTETFNTATYTVTVKVKSVPKNAKGLVMKIGGASYYARGNKKTYSFKVQYQDKKKIKGKKMKANFYWSSNTNGKAPLGLSPAKSANYKIKNGTYKVK